MPRRAASRARCLSREEGWSAEIERSETSSGGKCRY